MYNQFLDARAASRDAGELTPRSWQDYKTAWELIVSHFGKGRLVADLGPEDFATLRTKMGSRRIGGRQRSAMSST